MKKQTLAPALIEYLAQIGGEGGRAGTGKAKVRGGTKYYADLAKASHKARAKKKAAQKRG